MIHVEVKCFATPRSTAELHRALGQYITYRVILVILDREGFNAPFGLPFQVGLSENILMKPC
jgi:hypothetical protein